jgi:glycosyltransferase involved in cell wall biosynthesis
MKNPVINIDLYNDEKTDLVSGWRVVSKEISLVLSDKVDLKQITFDKRFKKIPYSRYLNYIITYPQIIKQQSRDNSIAFFPHQELGYLYSFFNFKKSIIICHDIIPYLFPISLVNKLFFTFAINNLKKADYVITDSNNTKRDLCEKFLLPKEKIITLYPGINKKFKETSANKKELFRKYGIPLEYKYILYVGSEAKHKNIKRLLQVISKLEKKHKLFFIKIGNSGNIHSRRNTNKVIKDLKIKNIKIIDKISEDDIIGFYNSVDLLLYPSLYEGFGLPPLEAMACGCPVITSNTSSLPEVVGDAGILVDPYDTEAIAIAVEKVLLNKKIREDMIEKGLKQAKKFSWENYCKELLLIFTNLNSITKNNE